MAELSNAQERFGLEAAAHAQAAAEELTRSTAAELGKRLESVAEQLLQRQERMEAHFESRLGEAVASTKHEREFMTSKLSELGARMSEALESRMGEADAKAAAAAEVQERRLAGIERLEQTVIDVASTQRADNANLQAALDNAEQKIAELASKMSSLSESSRSAAQRFQELEILMGCNSEAAQLRDDCAIMQQRLEELRDAFHDKAERISDLEARLPSLSSLSEVARLERRLEHTVSRQQFQQVVADLTSKLETRGESNRWSALDSHIAARTTDKLDAIAIDDRINANAEIRRLKETVAALSRRDASAGWLREPTSARPIGRSRTPPPNLSAILTESRMDDAELLRLKSRVEELARRLEDIALRGERQHVEACSEGELRLQETVSGLAKRLQEIFTKVDSKADAMDTVSAAVLEQRLRPLSARLEQKLDAAVHVQELSQLERKLGQLEQRGRERSRVRGLDDNEVLELREAVSALDRELKDGLASCRKKVSVLERKLEDKVDNDAVAPLLSSASERMKELVALIRH
jgi:DNA repair exonuclease SbcCD ATPase subunit